MIPLHNLIFCTCETYLSTSSQVVVFGNRTEDIRKIDCFQIFHISRNTRSTLACPETQTFQCHGTTAEESKISIAEHGINFTFGPSLTVSCSYNDDHCVVQVHVVQQVHFERDAREIGRFRQQSCVVLC